MHGSAVQITPATHIISLPGVGWAKLSKLSLYLLLASAISPVIMCVYADTPEAAASEPLAESEADQLDGNAKEKLQRMLEAQKAENPNFAKLTGQSHKHTYAFCY